MSTTRRTAMSLAATGGAGLLAACGGGGSPSARSGGRGAGPVSIPVAEVPEGGGLVRDRVVVTQPVAGEFKAFDATCPHQGCLVADVTAEAIECPCHGSRFDPSTGAVTQGPATRGLTAMKATVEGADVTVS